MLSGSDLRLPRFVGAALALATFASAVDGRATESSGQPSQPGSEDSAARLKELELEQLLQVQVSPFEASTQQDSGYRAFSSVTASHLDTPIQDSPFAIQAFTQSFIEDQHPITVFDVARYSPSVTYRSNDFNEGNANMSIRGFAVGNTPGSTQIFRDGFHGPSILDSTNVARVEVVKGPASFLYGQLAPGGIVNVITKSPEPTFAATARAKVGSYDSYRFDGDVTGPALEVFRYRAIASVEHDISYWKPYDAHWFDLAPSVIWQPSERMSLTLKAEYFGKRESPQVMQKPGYSAQKGVVPTPSDPNLDGVDVPGLPNNWNSMSFADFRNSFSFNLEAWLDVKADDHWSLRASYAHQKYQVDAAASGNFGMSNDNPFAQGRRFRHQTYTNWDDTVEGAATGKYSLPFMSLRLLVGAEYITRRFDNSAGQVPNTPGIGPIASPVPNWDLSNPTTWNRNTSFPLSELTDVRDDETARFWEQAAYAGATLGFFDDRLLVLAGERFTQVASRDIDLLTNTAQPEFTAHKLTPQFGVLYKLPPGLSLYASYAESFVPEAKVVSLTTAPTPPAQPTQGRGVDLGLKANLLGGRLTGTLTVFDILNKNIPNDIAALNPTTGAQTFTTVTSGEQRSRGVELDALLTLMSHWQTYVSFSYDDAKITEFSGNDAAILAAGSSAPGYKQVFLFHNAPLQMSAPFLANLWSRFDVPRGTFKGAYVAGGVNLVFDQTILPDTPSQYRQTYGLINATIGYSRDLWRHLGATLEVYGKNLANAQYRPSQSTRSRPREFGLVLKAEY